MKSKLFLLCLMLVSISAISQETEGSRNTFPVTQKNSSLEKFRKYDMTQVNRPKAINSIFENDLESNISNRSNLLEVESFAQIEVDGWGIITNLDTDGDVFYSFKRPTQTSAEIKTYDNDLSVVDSFTLEIPESANQVQVLNHYSSNFFNDDASKEFLIYLHYFDEEIPGPDGQIWEVWVVNDEGEVLQTLNATSVDTKIDAEGNKKLFTYFDNDEDVVIKSFDVSTWEVVDTYSFETDLIHFFMGSPFDFVNIEGEDFIVIAHYKHLYLDNDTMQIFPDNNLLIKILDLDFNEVKSISLDIDTRYPGAEDLLPMAQFGMFYKEDKYDVSKNIFNADDKFEVVYGIYYFDMMNDTEWSNFILANEDGEILKVLKEFLIDSFMDMNSIEGHDNQIGFLMGEGGQATTLGFFDIESWEMVKTFSAEHNGDLLSSKFNRIAHEDTYHYVIGLGEPDMVGSTIYGVISEYEISGEEFKRHSFELPENVVLFDPMLTSYSLTPNLYTEDQGQHFMYVYKEQVPNGSAIFNNLVIAKNSDDVLVEFRGDTEMGNITGSAFLTNGSGVFDKMTVQYEPGNRWVTDFYRLPFESDLSVDDQIQTAFSVYPNPTNGVVNFKSNASVNSVQVYSILGNLVIDKSLEGNQTQFDLSNLPSGVYIANLNLENGMTKKIKLIKN